ncbi:unnamed protein product [Rotaria socialis]|uniref:Uncharacterized protein n=2 Tax=Rotaria socialis TaxID=392032 RepID=A0A821F4E7_9BILA|nr:unnamed protein product [Rotaria socialis]
MHDITGAGLHKELSNGSKFLLMHEVDSNLTKLEFYHQDQAGSASARSLLCEAFDGFTESSKTTRMYDFLIKDSRLSLLGATTGSSLHLLLAHYTIHKISDECGNRFLYHFTENDLIPYDLVRQPDPFLPSIKQIFVIVHLIGRIVYEFTDATGNDEAQRYYATKGRYYIEEGRRLFRERQQSHLQSFYSKSAENFPRICVNMQRFLDAMMVLLKMRQGGDLQFSQAVDEKFVIKAKKYIEFNLNNIKNSMGDFVSYVNLETCQIASNLYDNYLFKTTMALFTLDTSPLQPSLASSEFRSLLGEKLSIEKRLLQLPFQFFLRSDLKQPTVDESGEKINAPFHHVDGHQLNIILIHLNTENEVPCVTSANDLAGNDYMFETTLLDHISASNTTILMVDETLNNTNKGITDHDASGTNNNTKEKVFQTDIINDTEFDLNILINTNHDRTTDAFQQLHTNETESDTTIEILEKTVDIEPKGIVKRS